MEYAVPETLTREEMLHALKEHELDIPEIEIKPLQTIMQIFKNFVVARPQREQFRKCHNTNKHHCLKAVATEPLYKSLVEFEMEWEAVSAKHLSTMREGQYEHKCCKFLESPAPVLGKRLYDCRAHSHASDDFLSSATKRIKIES